MRLVCSRTIAVLAILAVVAAGFVVWAAEPGPQEEQLRQGEQPIPFSHKVHAGDNKIPCQYCHINARRAAVAGVPSVQRCMGCHKITALDKPGVIRLKEYWDRKAPIRWVKVRPMPDFIFFAHWPHVRKGIECQACHGPVESMDTMRVGKPLLMQDCLACHRREEANIDCVVCHK